MPSIIIRIIPQQAPTDPDKFTTDYLNPAGLGPLQITAYDLSFNSPTTGQSVGTATYVGTASSPPSPTSPQPSGSILVFTPPQYNPDPTSGIVQQYDLWPPPDGIHTAFFSLASVATAIIAPSSTATIENLRLVAQWGSGADAPSVTTDFYDVTLYGGSVPDLNGWNPVTPTGTTDPPVADPWGQLDPATTPILYFQLPIAPTATAPGLQLPSDGTPPAFQDLYTAVTNVLGGDPGTNVSVATTANANAGDTTLQIAANTTSIGPGMNASGAAGLPAGTTVLGIDSSGLITLNQQLSAPIGSGTAITFSPDLRALTVDQCQNIAYEIVWSQQPPLPTPPDPLEDLYSNPPNNGAMLGGSNNTTPNQYEGDRQQFEAQLKSYYASANATAQSLTNFVFALAAAVACQQRTFAASQALIDLPANPAVGVSNDTQVVLSGLGSATASAIFGVPAAYFYALAATMPSQVTVQQRYVLATRDTLTSLLADLTTAIEAGTVTDSEGFTTPVLNGLALTGSINAAQAARRLNALNVPASAATPLAPLDTFVLQTSSDTPSGSALTFASVANVSDNMLVADTNVVAGTTVASVAAATESVTLSAAILNDVPSGSGIVFAAAWSGDLQSLVQSWLAFPPASAGAISSVSYQPGDDDTQFWPGAANAHPAAFFNLVLSALTQGAMLPAPFTGSLGDQIAKALIPNAPSTVEQLAAVTDAQWTKFFQDNPTWLPAFTQPGDTNARIAAFIRAVQKFFTVTSSVPASPFVLATSAPTNSGAILHFPPQNALPAGISIVDGMSVSGQATIPAGTTVKNVAPTPTSTDVTLNRAVTGAGVPAQANVTFTVTVAAGAGAIAPTLPGVANDWFTTCLTAYGAYTPGGGFDVAKLQAVAVPLMSGDLSAAAWLVEALVALDALYAIVTPVAMPAWLPMADKTAYQFSIVEALYARGFTSTARINALTTSEFQQALAGTVAYDLAAAIQTAAASAPPAGGGFQPINPNGALTDCIPPPCSSPLGPVTYLSELLNLASISTCEAPVPAALSLPTNGDTQNGATLPFVSTVGVIDGMSVSGSGIDSGTTVSSLTLSSVTLSKAITGDVPDKTSITFTAPTLATVLAARRGPPGNLAASCANLETPLPLIDLVNESLEYMASLVISGATPVTGQVYNTSADALAGHALCQHEPCPDEAKPGCHDPARLFAAVPEYSTPATPVAANEAVEPLVWNTLKSDFSACRLPYSQALDVSRSYLRHFGSCRFEEMRTFRKCITEFVLDPTSEPTGFADYLWRYPVRIDIAREYLGITPEEYTLLFAGAPVPLCGKPVDRDVPARPGAAAAQEPWQLYGFSSPGEGNDSWLTTVAQLPEFLARTRLSYCEFYELWQSGYVQFLSNDERQKGAFPQCEPCCLDTLSLRYPDEERSLAQGLMQLAIFIRLWRTLKESCCLCLTFSELSDFCSVLQLFNGASPNPDFIRQLAAFQMLREQFRLELRDPRDPPAAAAVGADRTQILALWVGPTAKQWAWAIRELCEKIVLYARQRGSCEHRGGDFAAMLASHLDALARLAGFDPASATDNWHALPTHTLRLAEILAKLAGSRSHIGELLYLFTATDAPGDGGPFPLQDEFEAQELPLGLPDEEAKHSLWRLRRELLASAGEVPRRGEREVRIETKIEESDRSGTAEYGETHREQIEVEVEVDEIEKNWDWWRVRRVLEEDLGFAAADALALAQHFFAHVLERAGHPLDAAAPRFTSTLAVANTTPAMWTGRAGTPFQYDASTGGGQLWARIPIADEEVIEQLTSLQALNANEQSAVQDLYFQPRAMLARFALLFPDFTEAQRRLIEERDGEQRWHYFRWHVALCLRRCHIIAAHLSRHVAAATRQECPEDHETAMLVLKDLLGDENKATANWENDAGTPPAVAWTPPTGGAFAALLGLLGTGLIAEYKLDGGALVWRDQAASLDGFGPRRDRDNAPVPTVLPSLAATLPASEAAFLAIRNGFLLRPKDGDLVGGAQGFDVTWYGALLIEDEGHYEFCAGAPTPCGEKPDWEAVHRCRWRAVLKRGSRSWVILSHQWAGEEERLVGSRDLRRGAYEITVELVRPEPAFASADRVHRVHGGLEIKYCGPDSGGERVALPRQRLFAISKDNPLGNGIAVQSAGAAAFLATRYTSSLRDIRRTYQRAFKALLFVHRLDLRGRDADDGDSELGFMLQNEASFAGAAYYRSGGGFAQHLADFNFNFLPIVDDYDAPAADQRTNPSPQRTQAMFDWWERLLDYTVARDEIHRCHDRRFWRLFAEAEKTQPADPAPLVANLGVAPPYWPLGLRYYTSQASPVYAVTAADLEDERWGLRAWHAERWLAALARRFGEKDIGGARPDLWASDDPSALVAGEAQTGNANLGTFVMDGCIENGEPRRYDDLRRVNDDLRRRGCDALLAWLCAMNRVMLPWVPGQFAQSPRDLSDLLLLDVETGLCERASRIEEAISAVQTFVRRARLHLEPGWVINRAFAHLWDAEFSTFAVWRVCKERHLYKESWIEWDDLRRARRVEAFRTLESKLQQSELAIAAPGGGVWWPRESALARRDPDLLQVSEPSRMALLPAPHVGLNLLGTPDYAGRPSWLALVAAANGTQGGGAEAAAPAGANANEPLPVWMEAAIRLGTRFWRIAAASQPPGAAAFAPRPGFGTRAVADECVSCCGPCECDPDPCLDEYYFWLVPGAIYVPASTPAPTGVTATGDYQDGFQDDFYDPVQQTSTVWQDPAQLPQLLEWPSLPTVRLAWCHLHDGQFGQPRRSTFSVHVDSTESADMQFLGRTGDSLTFAVTNGIAPTGYADPSAPGFRYDIAEDDAVVLPQVLAPNPATPPTFVAPFNLAAYPYFLYFTPGAALYPLTPLSPSLVIATALRTHCSFEAALAWYREAFDPLREDCTWIDCHQQDAQHDVALPGGTGACCDATDVSCDEARNRSVILHYLETLVEWSDALRHRGNAPEAFQQAWALLDVAERILGRAPRKVWLVPPASPPTVTNFTPAFAPLNPRLIDLYEVVADRLALIRTCQSARRLPDRRADGTVPYFGGDPLREGGCSLANHCAEDDWCAPRSPYRFAVLIQKAQDYAARVEQFGAAFLAAVEKGDAELLAALRAGQEREILTLGLTAQEDAWRDADWAIEALQKTKAMSQANLNYYQGLIQAGLIGQEVAYEDLTEASTVTRGVAETIDASSGVASAIGNYFVGVAGFGGTPLIYSQLPPGAPLAGAFAAVARIMIAVADALGTTAGLNLTEAGWSRRLQEWNHQVDILTIEIQQIERQILGAQRRRGSALKNLDMHQRQIEHATDVQNFLRDKFTAPELYLYLQKETAGLHRRMYTLALDAARQAQHAFNLERGHTRRHFVPDCAWDDLHQGLLAGERLGLALRHMEKAYMDENAREHELIKQFSLRLHFPMAFLKLRATGCCEIDIPEWMFDLDYPGHFMRRIRNLTVTIPCVTGPFTGVHCRLTLLASMTRIDPRRSAPAHECCCPGPCCDACGEDERLAREYRPCPDDPRIVRHYGAREAIATSGGRDDSGMFQLDFNDQRYLPFEYMGAVSRWCIELRPENNYFDRDSLTDFVIRVGHTSREGGEPLREAAFAAARHYLPGNGWRFFELRHDFPDAWQQLRDSARDTGRHAHLRLCLDRQMFPFIPHANEITLEGMVIVFGMHSDDEVCAEFEGCPCPEPRRPAVHGIAVKHCEVGHSDAQTVLCRTSDDWPDLYYGAFTAEAVLGNKRHKAEFDISFGDVTREIGPVFLLCRYRTEGCSVAPRDPFRDMQNSFRNPD
ncbi:insecticidal toxin complex protein [Paraburkholderia guartelaensis]|uniref:Insecticidal toxin complex protein n=1 Tax=Paraburkholderia guartelaensis TaxID=2546446 RepID=A0A4R5L1Y7_9BURK|nr:neuraminidase-like domain-containing protein [Paraburkholderia guartelaensis]TDG02548.1 insecticidal toxin complex protein [Paraburkholderia guartelaensis]